MAISIFNPYASENSQSGPKNGNGIYWISGKAGSGKSSLIKNIFDDSKTHRYLKVWAKEGDNSSPRYPQILLCLPTFFFWNSGTREQKSQSGLLKALLSQVLSACPNLVPLVFPERWPKRYTSFINGLPNSFDQALTSRRLTTAFRRLSQYATLPLKICFLVDGLD